MKKASSLAIYLLVIILSLSLNSCKKCGNCAPNDIIGSWKVISFFDGKKTIKKSDKLTWPQFNNGDITANFSTSNSDGKGEVSGITVTNSYTGEYSITGKGEISIGPVTSTLVNEPEWTKYFNLQEAEKYIIKNSTLTIYYSNNNGSVTFIRN